MRKIIIVLFISFFTRGVSQADIYPTETSFGGGIGFSTMYLVMNELPGEEVITRLGLDVSKINYRPMVFYGGEGFAQMVGPWRLGGYAGFGAAQTSNVFDVYYYKDEGDVGYNEGETIKDTGSNLSVSARINMLLGAMTVEYVFPLYRDLEVMTGSLMGIGHYTLSVDQHVDGIDDDTWASIGNDAVAANSVVGNGYYISVADPDNATDATTRELKSSYMTELGGTFFNFQPYVAVRWQFLDRMGLRISAGYNRGTIGAGQWKMNGHISVLDSPEAPLDGFTIRTVIYFGL